MKTKAQVVAFAKRHGIELDISDSGCWDVSSYAPPDKVFSATGGQVVVSCWSVTPNCKPEFWQRVYDDLMTIGDAPDGFESEIY